MLHRGMFNRGFIDTMSAFDPTCSKAEAFASGFLRGLASPMFVQRPFELPEQGLPLKYQPLSPRSGVDGQYHDWTAVGDCLMAAAAKIREGGGN